MLSAGAADADDVSTIRHVVGADDEFDYASLAQPSAPSDAVEETRNRKHSIINETGAIGHRKVSPIFEAQMRGREAVEQRAKQVAAAVAAQKWGGKLSKGRGAAGGFPKTFDAALEVPASASSAGDPGGGVGPASGGGGCSAASAAAAAAALSTNKYAVAGDGGGAGGETKSIAALDAEAEAAREVEKRRRADARLLAARREDSAASKKTQQQPTRFASMSHQIRSTFHGLSASTSGIFGNPNGSWTRRKTYRFMIHPRSSFRVGWDIASLLLLTYIVVAFPYRVSFAAEARGAWDAWEALIDAFFCADVFVNLRTGFVAQSEPEVGSREMTCRIQIWVP